MRPLRTMLTPIIMLIAAAAAAAAEFDVIGESLFGGSGSERGYCMRPTADGGLILMGSSSSTQFGDEDFYLVKLDADLRFEWEGLYGGDANDRGRAVAQAADGGFILAGYRDLGFPSTDNGLLIKVDADGNQEWMQQYGGTESDTFSGVCATGDGGFAACGTTASHGDYGDSFWMVKVDADGALEWDEAHGGGGDYLTAVVEDESGNLLASGYRKAGGGYVPPWDAALVKRSAVGGLLYTRIYDFSDYDRAYDLRLLEGGEIALAGPTIYGMGLWRVSSGGALLWHAYFNSPSNDVATSLWENADGSFIVGGYTSYELYAAKAAAGGQPLWEQHFGNGDENKHYAMSVCQTAGGDYAFFGFTDEGSDGPYDLYLLLLEGGGDPTSVDGEGAPEAVRFAAYPNPFNPATRIAFELPAAGQARLEILDASGRRLRLLHEGPLEVGRHEIDWRGRDDAGRPVAGGLYFARLTAGGESRSFKLALIK